MENKNKTFWEKATKAALDTIFPISCLGCNNGAEWLCNKCFLKISAIELEQFCPICEKSRTPDGKTCFACRKKTSLDGLLVCVSYKEKLVSKMIHSFKYKFIPDLHEPLGKIIIEKILASKLTIPEIIIPVPLHQTRLRWRGFNQSELLGEYVSKNLAPGFEIQIPKNTLERTRPTKSQMKINDFQERKRNIAGAFSINQDHSFKEKSILLIDDVATTGSTLLECAEVLKKAGAKEVLAVVVARQELTEH